MLALALPPVIPGRDDGFVGPFVQVGVRAVALLHQLHDPLCRGSGTSGRPGLIRTANSAVR